uniref:Ribonuclease A-domain domain-containing protein n=1 Tax=Neogobius melanostomus TaxID=47308 RepID=A0A8C6U052_9GOBI
FHILSYILIFRVSPRQCYKKFINQHINQGMSQTRCDNVMRTRQITESTSNQCKETNTFILVSAKEVKKVRGKSLQPFPVVNCKQRNKRLYPHCEYGRSSATRYIVISCEQSFPCTFKALPMRSNY